MRTGYAFLAALSLSLTQRASAQIYSIKDQWVGTDFYQGWNWETENDPTHGRVNYVGMDDAQNKNLTYGASFVYPQCPPSPRVAQLILPLAL